MALPVSVISKSSLDQKLVMAVSVDACTLGKTVDWYIYYGVKLAINGRSPDVIFMRESLSNTNVVFLWLFLIFHFSFSQTFFLSDTRGTKNKSELTFITLITAVHPLGVLCRYRCFSEGKEVGTEELEKKEEEQELPECLQLHQMVVRKIGEMCRVVNQVVTSAPQAASLSLFVAA